MSSDADFFFIAFSLDEEGGCGSVKAQNVLSANALQGVGLPNKFGNGAAGADPPV